MNKKVKPILTLEDIEKMDKQFLVPTDICDYLRTDAHSIRLAAHAGELPWAYCMGSRIKIPKERFVAFHKGIV